MTVPPELSRRVAVRDIGDSDVCVDVVPSEDERRALAARFDLLALDRFAGRARLARTRARDGSGPAIRVDLDYEADVVQRCVVTLDPVPAHVAETGAIVEYAEGRVPEAEDLPVDGIDPPEALEGEEIDVGELLAQHLGVALDVYPRSPGATLEFADTDRDTVRHPFAALAALRRGKGSADDDD